ncbi:DUF2867 domain-containing protein [Streptomyces sp. GD-15H]|uniref:DUF2867 domain-containing protein n=1 Tax=Streptomyces sp. GD-15H TaxID=3129112 RepID=UPI0032470AAC
MGGGRRPHRSLRQETRRHGLTRDAARKAREQSDDSSVRDAEHLRVGDSLAFWRVEESEPGQAAAATGGDAAAEPRTAGDGHRGRTRYRQRALLH